MRSIIHEIMRCSTVYRLVLTSKVLQYGLPRFVGVCGNSGESYEQKAEVNNQLITSAQSLFMYCSKRPARRHFVWHQCDLLGT